MTRLETALTVSAGDLAELRGAGARLLDVMHALQRQRSQVQRQLIGEVRAPELWRHYPEHDVFDADTGYRYFYHSHPGPRSAMEHGHFHLFARAPEAAHPCPAFTHLLAISMSPQGLPLRGFTTNRWVTDEHWQPATVLRRLVRRFALRRPRRLALVHRWLEAVVQLFRPQIDWLHARRDERWLAARERRPHFFEDRRSSVLSECAFDLSRQFAWLERMTPAAR
jgi:hypothetical protein